MASNHTTKKSPAELDKPKESRAISRIDANLIMSLSTLITAENEDTCNCLLKITQILSSSLKKYAYESDEFVKFKEIFLKLIQDCFLRIPLILEHTTGQKFLKDVNTSLRSIVQVLLEIANNGIEFRNYYFMNLFKMIMLVLVTRNEKLEFATQKILFLHVKHHITKLLPRTQKYLMSNNNDILELLAIWLPNSADYETQEAILETLMIFSRRSKQKNIKMKNWFKNYPSFYQAIDNLDYNHFIESSREFLVEVNKQITNNVKVYILPCLKAYADDIELKKPQSDLYKEFWVDFSVRSGHIQLYCSADEEHWGKFSIDFSNVNCITNENENSQWKVKIEFVYPLEICIYSSIKNFKTITLYFPCNLQFQEIQKKFFLIVFPHIYKIKNDDQPNGIRKLLRDKAVFEQSFFTSSVISSIRPISPQRAKGLETSWSASVVNVRTSTPKRTDDAGMENQKTGPSNIFNESKDRICDAEDRKIKSNGQELPSNNQNEVNLNDKDERATPNLQEIASNKFTKIDEQNEEDGFSTPTGEINCETLNNGINHDINNAHKNNIQYSNSNQTITNLPETACCTNVSKSQNCHDKASCKRFPVNRNKLSENNNNMVQSSELNTSNDIYKGAVPKKVSLSTKHLFNNFSIALRDFKQKSSQCANKGSVQNPGQANLDDKENFGYKTENKMKRNYEKIEKYKIKGHEPRSYLIGYQRSREIKDEREKKDINETGNKRKSQKLVQRSNPEIRKTPPDRIEKDKITVYNYRSYQDDQLESGSEKELHKDAYEMKKKSQKVEQTGIEIMKALHDSAKEVEIMEYVSKSNQDDHLGSGIVKEFHKDVREMKRKSQKIEPETVAEMNKDFTILIPDSDEEDEIKGYDPRSYEDNQLETGGIKELDNDTSVIKNSSQRIEQKAGSEMMKTPREYFEGDEKVNVCHPRSYQDNQFETGRMEELDNDTSVIKNSSQRIEQKAGRAMKKTPRESVESDEIKICHPRSYQENQFETERMDELDNDTSLIKNSSQRIEQKAGSEMEKTPRESVESNEIKICHRRSYQDNQFETERMDELDNDTSLLKNKSQRVERKVDSGIKKGTRDSVEEQEIKICDTRSYQEGVLDNDIHVIKKKAQKIKQKSDVKIKKAQDLGLSVTRPIRTYSKSKYPPKRSILDNTSNAIFDSIKQTIDSDKINDSINLSNDKLRSRSESNKRKLYTPRIKVHLNDSLDSDYVEEDNNKKTKLFLPEKKWNIKKDHSPLLFDDVSEALNNDYTKTKYRVSTRKSNNIRELRNLPRKTYEEISSQESISYSSKNSRQYRKLLLNNSPSYKPETLSFSSGTSSFSASPKKPTRKLLSYTRTKYGKSKTSTDNKNKKLQNNEKILTNDVAINTENNNGEAIIINAAASSKQLFTDNISASTSNLESLLKNHLTNEQKKKMHDEISRMMINARSALNEEIIGHGKQYYDTVHKLQSILTNIGNQLKQMSILCNDIAKTTDLVNKTVTQPVNNKELYEFVNYLKENNYYLELNNEQVNDKNFIAKINAYFDINMDNNE